jgi:hypothetical protein
VKRAGRDARVGPDGRDARDHLAHEAAILERLAPDRRVPRRLDLVEHDGDLYLVMEHLAGQALGAVVSGPCEAPRAVAWGGAGVGARRDPRGRLIYRDLNLQRVVVGEDGAVRLVDFELATEIGSTGEAAGTPGTPRRSNLRASPPRSPTMPSRRAVVWFRATGVDPDAPGGAAVADERLKRIIARCLTRPDGALPLDAGTGRGAGGTGGVMSEVTWQDFPAGWWSCAPRRVRSAGAPPTCSARPSGSPARSGSCCGRRPRPGPSSPRVGCPAPRPSHRRERKPRCSRSPGEPPPPSRGAHEGAAAGWSGRAPSRPTPSWTASPGSPRRARAPGRASRRPTSGSARRWARAGRSRSSVGGPVVRAMALRPGSRAAHPPGSRVAHLGWPEARRRGWEARPPVSRAVLHRAWALRSAARPCPRRTPLGWRRPRSLMPIRLGGRPSACSSSYDPERRDQARRRRSSSRSQPRERG